MKIQIISDIHLEFGIKEFDFSTADLLILAGDVSIGMACFTWISERIKSIPVLYVLGNHEYFKNSYIVKTRVISNPKGYPGEILERFNDNLIIEIVE